MPNDKQQITFPLDLASIQILVQALSSYFGSGTSTSSTGRSHGGISTLAGGNTSETSMAFATNDFAHGITWGSNKFTVVTAGRYLVLLNVRFIHISVDGTEFGVAIYKNGSKVAYAGVQSANSSNTNTTGIVSDLIDCSIGDVIEFYAVKNTAPSVDIDTNSANSFAYIALQ